MASEQIQSKASKTENNQSALKPPAKGEISFVTAGAGFCFLATTLVCLGSIIYLLVAPSKIGDVTTGQKLLAAYMNPLALFAAAIFCVTVGYVLLRNSRIVAGAVPRQDQDFLTNILREHPNDGFEMYIKLRETSGSTAFLNKAHLTGLPMAMIGLTILFALLGLLVPALLDLAKLTLGALIGSYAQRRVEDGNPPAQNHKKDLKTSPDE
jgi:hypothetical protein